jgi:hypothetical protein
VAVYECELGYTSSRLRRLVDLVSSTADGPVPIRNANGSVADFPDTFSTDW